MPNKPDLITNGSHDDSDVIFRMTRRHANILGAYLNGRNEIAPIPEPLREVLDALTMRLVGPPGSKRWNDLRCALDGQPTIDVAEFERWRLETTARANAAVEKGLSNMTVYNRPRRPYDGGPNGEDLRDHRGPNCGHQKLTNHGLRMYCTFCNDTVGDVDGTTWEEFRNANPETD